MQYRETGLEDMLQAREKRYEKQQALLRTYKQPLICFTMNIAGPVKNSSLIQRGFLYGDRLLRNSMSGSGLSIIHREITQTYTGNEGFYVIDGSAKAIKALTSALENETPAGRLFDMDVLDTDGRKIERQQLGLPPRQCLICGRDAHACAGRRTHSVTELQNKTRSLLTAAFYKEDAEMAAEMACKSLLYEVCTTPKPGLVDRDNNGSHTDMDMFTFMTSTMALHSYFSNCVKTGYETAEKPPRETFDRLRIAGREAEAKMFRETGGINTHKGIIFSMGILCGALGRLPREAWGCTDRLSRECAAIAEGIVERDFASVTADTARTAGQKIYCQYGIGGIREQAQLGFPAVMKTGIHLLEQCLRDGLSLNHAGCQVLLHMICEVTDTNLIARSDRDTQLAITRQLQNHLAQKSYLTVEELRQLDQQFIQMNLSPGGSADLLAMTYFVHFLKESAEMPV